MIEADLDDALAELDRLLNDPETRMDPDRVWSILAEVSPLVAKGLRSDAPAVQPARFAASRNSRLPSGPVMGLSATP